MAAADCGDVDVVVAVVVEVAHRATHAIHFNIEPGLARYIGECAVVIVVVERGVRFPCCVTGPVHRIDEEDVGPAVIVVIDDADAAAHGFGQILGAECAAVVFEMDTGLRGYIGEGNWARRTRHCRLRGIHRRRCG